MTIIRSLRISQDKRSNQQGRKAFSPLGCAKGIESLLLTHAFLTGYLKSVRFCTKHRSGRAKSFQDFCSLDLFQSPLSSNAEFICLLLGDFFLSYSTWRKVRFRSDMRQLHLPPPWESKRRLRKPKWGDDFILPFSTHQSKFVDKSRIHHFV